MLPAHLQAMLDVEESAAQLLHLRYGITLSFARDYAANCGMIDETSIVSEFLEEFPEFRIIPTTH